MNSMKQPDFVNKSSATHAAHSVYFYSQPANLKTTTKLPLRTPAIFNPDLSIHRDASVYLHSLTGLHRPATWRTYAYALTGC